jgi:4-hydroxy-tetrahydrodipicolinate reductase
MTIKILIVGCFGNMGQQLIQVVKMQEELNKAKLVGGIARNPIPADFLVFNEDEAEKAIAAADVVIDFTTPKSSMHYAAIAANLETSYVCGTTGFSAEQMSILKQLAQRTKILWAPNMSFGVNLLAKLVKQAAVLLKEFDAEIFEAHHRRKADSPSGTSLMLGRTIAEARGIDFEKHKVMHTGQGSRKADDIGFSVVRGGNIFGEHRVILAGEEEIVELSHIALNRRIFAEGAVRAASWLAMSERQKGHLYSIADVLE